MVSINGDSRQRTFPRLSTLPAGVAALFHWNMSRLPFLGQVVDLDLLLCTGLDLDHACWFDTLLSFMMLIFNTGS